VSVVALALVFTITQLYVAVTFGGPQKAIVTGAHVAISAQEANGVLSTQGNKAITVNGASAISGATIVSGANIETPAATGGTVNLGNRGSLQIDPGARLTLEFTANTIKVTLLQGCVILRAKVGTTGEVDTAQGVAGKTDPATGGVLQTCAPGSVAKAPAAAAGKGGLFGLGTASTIGLLVGTGTLTVVPILTSGGNSSPQVP
jgi:hypothetical protein